MSLRNLLNIAGLAKSANRHDEGFRLVVDGIASEWCRATHGGGHIERDPSGRVNWQCDKCGRWATPVATEDERRAMEADIQRYRRGE